MIDALASNTLLAAILGLVAWLCARPAQRPALGHSLFVLALAVLVTPPLVHVSLPSAPAAAPPAAEPRAVPSRPEPATARAAPATGPRSTAPADALLPPASAVASGSSGVSFASIWLLGALAFAAGAAGSDRRASRQITAATRATPPGVARDVARLCAELGIRRPPRIRWLATDVGPALRTRLGPPELLLPSERFQSLAGPARRAVLLHELAHLRRGDHRVRVLELLVTSVLWWHPLVWLLRHGLRRAEERACDALVVAHAPDCRRSYCEALLEFAGAPRHAMPLCSPAASHRVRGWKSRLEEIMTRELPTRSSRSTRAFVAILAAVCLPLGVAQERPGSQDSMLGRIRAARVAVDFTDASVGEWTRSLSAELAVPVEATPVVHELQRERTSLRGVRLPPTPGARLLDVLTTLTGLRWSVQTDRVVIDVRDAPATTVPTALLVGAWTPEGPIELQAGATLLDVMARHGITSAASLDQLLVLRTAHLQDPQLIRVAAGKMIETGVTTDNLRLQDGDILVLPPVVDPRAAMRIAPGRRVRFLTYGLEKQPGLEQLSLLQQPQTVAPDGTIFVPYVGTVHAAGTTETELGARVAALLQDRIVTSVQVHALLVDRER